MLAKFINPDLVKIFALSFLILFLELALIRWIPSQVRLVGYFTNLILLATFLGMGVGVISAKKFKPHNLILTPLLLIMLMLLVHTVKVEVKVASPEVIFFQGISEKFRLEPEIILPIIFTLVAAIFIPISQLLGTLFAKNKPLYAYSADIGGALIGVLAFSLLSYLSTPGHLWFITVAILLSGITLRSFKLLQLQSGLFLLACTGLVATALLTKTPDIWSPYYRISLDHIPGTNLYGVNVNNNSHQFISPYLGREEFYKAPYKLFVPNYQKILIIGSGTGADVATALGLNPGVQRIDSVEIDPQIAKLGVELNPDRPFSDPRVRVIIDDGRAFLQKSRDRYDLIIYALTDSLVLSSHSANIRLESFLFTKESFELAKAHLTDNGLFSLYNYYRSDWLVDKIALMLESTFEAPPHVISYGREGRAAIFLAGPKTEELKNQVDLAPYTPIEQIDLASDDWPFLYLKNHSLPSFFLKFLAVILVISLLMVSKVAGKFKFDLRLFLFGAGFMLLETKSLVTFSQLFGTTWLVNSLVISAVLSSILIANLISLRYTLKSLKPLFLAMFGLLALSVVLPSTTFANLPPTTRYVVVSIFYFSPLMLANILFSQIFKKSTDPATSFGSNLLGALVGGVGEYLSLITGYRYLGILIILIYTLSFIQPKPIRRLIVK